jgi:glycosyltransferase involved in cell wall biosynthesis
MDASVVVISRNEAPRLRLALASYEAAFAAARAEGIDAEIVVVDDGSTDATAQVLAAAANALPLRIVRNDPALGIAAARNRGAGTATGAILLFMDGDVLASPSMIRTHVRAHRERAQPAVVRGASAYLRCTRAFLDPEQGIAFPDQADAVARMSEQERASHLVTAAQVRADFATIDARAKPGIYMGAVNADLYAAEIEALERDGGRDVCWMSVPGHNVSLPKSDFDAVGGYDAAQVPVEHREIGLRLATRGLDIAYAPAARSYHLLHKSRGRDPLSGRQDWMRAFYARHDVPAARLMLILWHTIARTGAVPGNARIGSILELARILRGAQATPYDAVFRRLLADAVGTGVATG